jgi:hypothetical protein
MASSWYAAAFARVIAPFSTMYPFFRKSSRQSLLTVLDLERFSQSVCFLMKEGPNHLHLHGSLRTLLR